MKKLWHWFLAFGVLLPAAGLLAGYVIQQLWTWHVVPLGVKPIGLGQAIGIDALVTFMHAHFTAKPIKDVDGMHILKQLYVRPLAMLLIGWLALQGGRL